MMNATFLELYARLRPAELAHEAHRLLPARSSTGPGLRRRLAQALIGLGLRLDADASRSALRSLNVLPRGNASDA